MREYTMVIQRRERIGMKSVISVSYGDEIWDRLGEEKEREMMCE